MEQLFPLGWAHYLLGGLLLGAGMSLLFISTGLIGGMSTVFTTVWSFFSQAPYFQQERFVLQPASILSVVVFLATAMATARIVARFA